MMEQLVLLVQDHFYFLTMHVIQQLVKTATTKMLDLVWHVILIVIYVQVLQPLVQDVL
jgi:hypothetical protein